MRSTVLCSTTASSTISRAGRSFFDRFVDRPVHLIFFNLLTVLSADRFTGRPLHRTIVSPAGRFIYRPFRMPTFSCPDRFIDRPFSLTAVAPTDRFVHRAIVSCNDRFGSDHSTDRPFHLPTMPSTRDLLISRADLFYRKTADRFVDRPFHVSTVSSTDRFITDRFTERPFHSPTVSSTDHFTDRPFRRPWFVEHISTV